MLLCASKSPSPPSLAHSQILGGRHRTPHVGAATVFHVPSLIRVTSEHCSAGRGPSPAGPCLPVGWRRQLRASHTRRTRARAHTHIHTQKTVCSRDLLNTAVEALEGRASHAVEVSWDQRHGGQRHGGQRRRRALRRLSRTPPPQSKPRRPGRALGASPDFRHRPALAPQESCGTVNYSMIYEGKNIFKKYFLRSGRALDEAKNEHGPGIRRSSDQGRVGRVTESPESRVAQNAESRRVASCSK